MKIVLLRLRDGKPETKHGVKPQRRASSTREMEKKSITSVSTELVVLTMLGWLLSQSMRIEYDNRRDTNE